MTIDPSFLELGVVIVLFGAIIGCYVWAEAKVAGMDKRLKATVTELEGRMRAMEQEMEERIRCVEKVSTEELKSFGANLHAIAIEITDRLARLETAITDHR
ncbi:MAG: hypothetical protein WC977_13080 [Anaerovoracaceae bacterium]|jgi:hypothetical protein